jgi:hypothetical protein
MKTTANMSPVTERTSRDNPKIIFAGVDAGAKIFVELSGKVAGSAAARATDQKRNTKISTARFMAGFRPDCISLFLLSSAAKPR